MEIANGTNGSVTADFRLADFPNYNFCMCTLLAPTEVAAFHSTCSAL